MAIPGLFASVFHICPLQMPMRRKTLLSRPLLHKAGRHRLQDTLDQEGLGEGCLPAIIFLHVLFIPKEAAHQLWPRYK